MHDVAPATWPLCARLIAEMDALGPIPLTLLVVPWFHRGQRMEEDPEFVHAINRRRDRGDEIALHGYTHRDEEPVESNPYAFLMRRFYTCGEGEFAAVSQEQAHRRISEGLQRMRKLGWTPAGFVAPAWLLSSGARVALSTLPLAYTSGLDAFYRLPDFTRVATPTLVYSSRSGWRRTASCVRNASLFGRSGNAPLLRFALHPADAAHPGLAAQIRQLIARALESRQAMTKHGWLLRTATTAAAA